MKALPALHPPNRVQRETHLLLGAPLLVALALSCAACPAETVDGRSDGRPASDQGPGQDGTAGSDAAPRDLALGDAAAGDRGGPPADSGPPALCPGGNQAGTPPNGTVPGQVALPHPTLQNVAIVWPIEGDADGDSTVRVRFRRQGEASWRLGLPLRRVPAGSLEGFSWPDRHAGSIFDLQPATTYEVELWLQDPDGGCQVETSTVTTRAVPVAMAGATVKPATPATFDSVAGSAQPGDVIELAAGSYPGFSFGRDGAPGQPIVIRGSAGTIVNGSISLRDRAHLHLVGVTVEGGRIRFDRSTAIAVIGCTVQASADAAGDGIITWDRAEDAYIADNVVTGLTSWTEASLGASGDNRGEGILVNGPGHVVAHNRVTGFRDNISFVEDSSEDQYSIDVIENDILRAADDGIEADFCQHNCRIMRNRLTDVFVALSSQPGLGGPTYFIRNVVYGGLYVAAFKLHRGSIGDVALHNTVVKNGDALAVYSGEPHRRQTFRNNILIGGPPGEFNDWSTGSGRVMDLAYAEEGDFDYDGLGSTTGDFEGRYAATRFSSLAEMRAVTEPHGVQLDLGAFAASVPYPADLGPHSPPDLRPKRAGDAVDVGEILPNINDGFAGTAPDLGAYEVGAAVPAYGPR